MAREGGIYQPVDDINASSSTQGFPAVADGDENYSQSSSVEEHMDVAYGSGEPMQNNAEAFYRQQVYRGQERPNRQPQGPFVERPALFDERPLDDLHLGKVSAVATKLLLQDLLQVTSLTDIQRKEVDETLDRKQKVSALLKIWKINGNSKKVSDLLQLLQDAGGEREQYQELIATIRLTPP